MITQTPQTTNRFRQWLRRFVKNILPRNHREQNLTLLDDYQTRPMLRQAVESAGVVLHAYRDEAGAGFNKPASIAAVVVLSVSLIGTGTSLGSPAALLALGVTLAVLFTRDIWAHLVWDEDSALAPSSQYFLDTTGDAALLIVCTLLTQ